MYGFWLWVLFTQLLQFVFLWDVIAYGVLRIVDGPRALCLAVRSFGIYVKGLIVFGHKEIQIRFCYIV